MREVYVARRFPVPARRWNTSPFHPPRRASAQASPWLTADYWFSYGKGSLYGLEGGCNVFFRYDFERKKQVFDKVDLWGV